MSLELVATPDGTITRTDRGLWLTPPFNIAWGAASDTLLAALRAYLRSRLDLAELTDVYLTKTGPRVRFPYLIMNGLFDESELNTSESYISRETVQFTIHALDDLQADRLGRAAFQALTPVDRNPRMMFADGQEIANGRQMKPYQKPRELEGQGPKGVPVWMVTFDVEFWIERTL